MTAHSPDDRLSAFYDGELSAAERAEVERLVTAQPGLRAELNTLTGLSQQLSDLADDLPEIDLRPRVMQRIAASRPATLSGDAPTRRRWMPLALLVCSLTLLVAAVLPWLPLSNNTELDFDNGPRVLTTDELAKLMKDAAATPGVSAEYPGESIASLDSPAMASMTAPDGVGLGGVAAFTEGSENIDGTGPSELLARIERRRDLKPGDIVSQLIEGGDVPMIADYTVIDVRRTARDVEFLLQKHSIVPLLASDRRETSESTGGSELQATTPAPSEIIKVYLVDAETESLNTAFIECERLQEVVALNYLPLGLDEAGGAVLASQNGPAMQSADASPVVVGSPLAAPVAMPRAVTQPGLRSADEVVAKDASVARKSMAGGQPLPQDERDQQTDKKRDDVVRVKGKAASDVNGNSIIIENGHEFYSEVMQRQVQSLKNADRGYAVKQQQNIESPAISVRHAPASQALEALSNPNSVPQFDGRRGGNGVLSNNAYNNNAYNGGRTRQRAILVLRSQSPPPPPEATRLNR